MTLEHFLNHYPTHLKIYTDGSKLENGHTGAAFAIPTHKLTRSFYLGISFSIFTAELIGILQALKFIKESSLTQMNILLCVDSKSALIALQNSFNKHRASLITDIQCLISDLISSGINITFFWIPSHCGIYGNECVDKAAKDGAAKSTSSIKLNIPLDLHELYSEIERTVKENFSFHQKSLKDSYSSYCANYHPSLNTKVIWKTATTPRGRTISTLMSKLRLNALTTKYAKKNFMLLQ